MITWKNTRKRLKASAFQDEPTNSSEDMEGIDWLTATKRIKGGLLEDANVKSGRLKVEGANLAESGFYRQAIDRWNEALKLTPDRAALWEMKAQALLNLEDDVASVEAAESAVYLDGLWSDAHITLARCYRNCGHLIKARKSFDKALHLSPWERGITDEILEIKKLVVEQVLREKKQSILVKEPSEASLSRSLFID